MKARAATATALIALAMLSACSAQQGYATAQSWKRQQCGKVVDAQERIRCLKNANQSYDDYQNHAEGVRSGR